MPNAHFSRRQFLRRARTTALALGLGGVAPEIFLNRTKAATGQNPSELVRLGFIGVGLQGSTHVRTLAGHAAALCDVDSAHLASARKIVEDHTGQAVAAYADYRKLLEDKSIDAVVIATPDHWHVLAAIHACQAGKDVYCEKPLTYSIAEGQALVKAVRANKRILQTGSQQRSDTKFRRACELIRSGRLGKLKTVQVGIPTVNFDGPPVPDSAPPPELNYDFWLGPAPKRPYNAKHVHYLWRFFTDYCAGQLANWGSHHLDIVQWALGTDHSGPVEISGKARYHPQKWYEVPQWFEVTYQYAGGVTVHCSMDHRNGTRFEGENGTLFVSRGVLETTPATLLEEPRRDTDVRLYESRDHHQNWLECLKTRQEPICPVETGHRSASLCHLGTIAIKTGRTIRWDPAKEEIVGDAEAAKLLGRENRKPYALPAV